MDFIKEHKIVIVISVVLIITIPMICSILISPNHDWAGFYGGYIGAIIGAAATIIAVLSQIQYNEKTRHEDLINGEQTRKEDLIRQVKPYLCIKKYYYASTNDEYTYNVKLSIENIGLQSACDIYLYENDKDINQNNTIYSSHLSLGVNESEIIVAKMNFNKKFSYTFKMQDIRGNSYTQEMKLDFHNSSEMQNFFTLKIDKVMTLIPKLNQKSK